MAGYNHLVGVSYESYNPPLQGAPHRVSVHLRLTEWVVAAADRMLQPPQHVDEVTRTDHAHHTATLAVIQRRRRNAL